MFPCNADIVLYARQVAEDREVNLTPMSCAFYVKLFRLVQQEGEKSPDKNMHQIQYSYSQLAKKLHFSYKVVCNSMQLFLKSGLIEREAVSSKVYITYMDISVLDEV
ncbi:MAG: hypothetical protein K2H41_00835 [Acetatifactor sp.]|nr:hypothetical protein [Acetatifactor sp.]MDE7113664.1 hypothetical protein [Acetatifactor sp.]